MEETKRASPLLKRKFEPPPANEEPLPPRRDSPAMRRDSPTLRRKLPSESDEDKKPFVYKYVLCVCFDFILSS